MHNDLCISIIFLQYLSSIYLLNADLCILIIFLQYLYGVLRKLVCSHCQYKHKERNF